MANLKKVYFYKIKIKKKPSQNGNYLNSEEIKKIFCGISEYNEKGDPFSYKLKYDADKTVIELLDIKDLRFFGRIGKEEDLKYLHLRSGVDHKSQDIDVPVGSYAEKFTYFYYDLDTGILSYLSIQGAPNFRKFERFLNEICNGMYEINLIPVSNKNVIDYLKGKDIIPGFSFKTTIPADSFLGLENLGLSRDIFRDLDNAEFITINIDVKSKKRKNISQKLGNENPVFNIIGNICNSNSELKAKIKARNNNERTQIYDVVEEIFTYSIDLPNVKEDTLFNEAMKNALIEAYNNSIEAIQYMAQ